MSKIYLAEKSEVTALETPFLTCSTSAATAAKTVSVSGFTLKTGAMVNVKFSNGNTASNPTLNVNGTGAKYIYSKGRAAAVILEGTTHLLVYDGTYWQLAET